MKKLLVVWKSNNWKDVDYFITPFTINSKKNEWFSDVEVLIWGASADYIKASIKAKKVIREMIEMGIEVRACKYCADKVFATKKLEKIGVNVMYTGEYLSDKMKDPNYEVITL